MKNLVLSCLLIGLVIGTMCRSVSAQDAKEEEKIAEGKATPIAKKIEALIQKLGDENFDKRNVATEELIKIGEVSTPFLIKALNIIR